MRLFVFLGILFLYTTGSYSQVPDKLSYQAIIRNTDGTLVTDSEIALKVGIVQGTLTGTIVYEELHNSATNQNGLLTVQIGTGVSFNGNFSEIDWSNGPYFLETQLDLNGGSNFTVNGITELLSVPYALYARTAGGIVSTTNAYVMKAKIISLQSSRNILMEDIGNTIACTSTATLQLTANFNSMEIGDTINLEAHNGATLTVRGGEGVQVNYVMNGEATFQSTTGNVRFGLLRKNSSNSYIVSGQ